MKKKMNYTKIASYETEQVTSVLLLYSGGLDTSVMLKWVSEQYSADVYTLTCDLGQQGDDLESIKQKALTFGAKEAIIYDAKQEFAEEFLSLGIKANASYQGDYHLSTAIGRAILAKKAVEVAQKLGVSAIAHGCTGKGNDQVRLDGYITALAPQMKVIVPVREWDMDRNAEIAYAQKHHIPVPASLDFPYSVDDNIWGMTWEGGEIEDPKLVAPVENFLTTYTLPQNAPDKAELVTIGFKSGIPVSLNGQSLSLVALITQLNQIAGQHGVGVAHVVEDRIVGLKNRGVYEQPAGHVIITAHKALEQYVSTRELNELKVHMDTKWAYLCYGGKWYDPTMEAINAFNATVNKQVTGEVTVQLFKGNATVVALNSPFGLHHASFTSDGYHFNVNASAGFIEIYSLPMKLVQQLRS